MIKINFRIILSFIFILIMPSAKAYTGWVIETIDNSDISDGASGHNSYIVCNSSGGAWITYNVTDGFYSPICVAYCHSDGRLWGKMKLSLDLDYEYYAAGTSMAVTENGGVSYPHISACDDLTHRVIQVKQSVNDIKPPMYDENHRDYGGPSGTWCIDSDTSHIDAGNVGIYTSLDIQNTTDYWIAYYDNDNGDLKAARMKMASGTNPDTVYSTHTIDNATSDDVGQYCSMKIFSNKNDMMVSYYDYENEDLVAAWYCLGTSTSAIQPFVTAANDGKYTSLDIDPSGNVHIAYYDETNGSLLYKKSDGGGWDDYTVDDSGDVGQYCSLSVDSDGRSHIAYYDATNKNLKYAGGVVGGWSISTIDSEGNVGKYCSIDDDPTDAAIAHISYYDVTHQELKYAHYPTDTSYFIRGHVKYSYTAGGTIYYAEDALVRLIPEVGPQQTYTTKNWGFYKFTGLQEGNYKVIVEHDVYHFGINRYSPLESDQYGQDFTGGRTPISSSIHCDGYVRNGDGSPVQGAVITLSGSAESAILTDAQGYYDLTDLTTSGTFTVKCEMFGKQFVPAQRVYTSPADNLEDQHFLCMDPAASPASGENIKLVNNLMKPRENGKTAIFCTPKSSGKVTIKIYTSDGSLVKTLANEYRTAGTLYSDLWDGLDDDTYEVASGIYIVHINGGGLNEIKKIAVIR